MKRFLLVVPIIVVVSLFVMYINQWYEGGAWLPSFGIRLMFLGFMVGYAPITLLYVIENPRIPLLDFIKRKRSVLYSSSATQVSFLLILGGMAFSTGLVFFVLNI